MRTEEVATATETICSRRIANYVIACVMQLMITSDVDAELITAWKQVDGDTIVGSVGGVDLTIDSSADVFANGAYDAIDYGLKFDNGKFESVAVSQAAELTLTIPSNYRFTRVAVVGIQGTGSNPTISTEGEWVLEQAVGGPPITSVSGTDIDYISPFVASVLKLDNGSSMLIIKFSDQMEDDPFGFDIDVAQVPEPAGLPVVAFVCLLTCAGWQRRRSSKTDKPSEQSA
ncbi:MAG: hypothetical protein R3C02_00440 [Planctomycetaceae bacterium]